MKRLLLRVKIDEGVRIVPLNGKRFMHDEIDRHFSGGIKDKSYGV